MLQPEFHRREKIFFTIFTSAPAATSWKPMRSHGAELLITGCREFPRCQAPMPRAERVPLEAVADIPEPPQIEEEEE